MKRSTSDGSVEYLVFNKNFNLILVRSWNSVSEISFGIRIDYRIIIIPHFFCCFQFNTHRVREHEKVNDLMLINVVSRASCILIDIDLFSFFMIDLNWRWFGSDEPKIVFIINSNERCGSRYEEIESVMRRRRKDHRHL